MTRVAGGNTHTHTERRETIFSPPLSLSAAQSLGEDAAVLRSEHPFSDWLAARGSAGERLTSRALVVPSETSCKLVCRLTLTRKSIFWEGRGEWVELVGSEISPMFVKVERPANVVTLVEDTCDTQGGCSRPIQNVICKYSSITSKHRESVVVSEIG